jgi:CheY-like chemotaxis protein
MSHRLRTPLNAVLGFAALMARDRADPLSSRQRERLSRIDSAGHELLALVDDVFELASLADESAPAPTSPVPLARLLVQVQEAVLPLARQRQVRVQAEAVDGTIGIQGDPHVLVQALIHLVSHAVRRNEATGWVSLRVVRDADPGWCLLHLRDGGPRLTSEQQANMFDLPTTPAPLPEPAPSGDAFIGLGLVRHALERQGAELRWGGVEHAHTELTVRLPVAAIAPAPGGTAAVAVADAPALRLLCIEDNPVNTMLVQELVAMRPGIRLSCAADGLSGLALAAQERPHVVLLDLQLPDIAGQEVLARLRADPQHAGCAVIALSANAVPEDIRAARAAGFDDYWTKPIDFDRFLAGLDRLMQGLLRGPAAP